MYDFLVKQLLFCLKHKLDDFITHFLKPQNYLNIKQPVKITKLKKINSMINDFINSGLR